MGVLGGSDGSEGSEGSEGKEGGSDFFEMGAVPKVSAPIVPTFDSLARCPLNVAEVSPMRVFYI